MEQKFFVYLLICVTVIAGTLFAQERPFPQNLTSKSIPARLMTTSEMNKDIESYYRSWKENYLLEYRFSKGAVESSGSGYVLKAETNPSVIEGLGKTISQSEAHGWAMIVFALMAGNDSEAKSIFDGFYRVYRNFPCRDNADLMSWAIPADGQLTENRRRASATDGDMDVAYALILASEQWGGSPEGVSISYYDAAIKIITALESNNILYAPKGYPQASHFPRLGVGDNRGNYLTYQATRSSDFMLSHFRLFNTVRSTDSRYLQGTKGVPSVWNELTTSTLAITKLIQDKKTGLMPDFMGNKNGDMSLPISSFKGISDEPLSNPGIHDNSYWYNACRFPWRFAQSYFHDSIPAARDAVLKLTKWVYTDEIHAEWGYFSGENIRAGYTLSGSVLENGDYLAKAFAAPIMTAFAADTSEPFQWHVKDMWKSFAQFTDPNENSTNYYDNTITILNMLLVSGNWWRPSGEKGSSSIEGNAKVSRSSITVQVDGIGAIRFSKPVQSASISSVHGRILDQCSGSRDSWKPQNVPAPGNYIIRYVVGTHHVAQLLQLKGNQ